MSFSVSQSFIPLEINSLALSIRSRRTKHCLQSALKLFSGSKMISFRLFTASDFVFVNRMSDIALGSSYNEIEYIDPFRDANWRRPTISACTKSKGFAILSLMGFRGAVVDFLLTQGSHSSNLLKLLIFTPLTSGRYSLKNFFAEIPQPRVP